MATAPAKLGIWGKLQAGARELVDRAKNEHSTPSKVGLSVGAGIFSACTPFIGFHMWIALALATFFRLNRLWAFLGSRVSIVPVYLWISFCEIELGHRLRSGRWLRLSARDALSQGRAFWIDWGVGTLLIGGALAALGGLVAYRCARGWGKARVTRVTPRTLDATLERSSESPPSARRGSTS